MSEVTSSQNVNSITGGVDYDSGPYTVTFPAGETSVSFDVPITNDNILEGDETFTVAVDPSSLPNDVEVGDPSSATVTIVNDDCELLVCMIDWRI